MLSVLPFFLLRRTTPVMLPFRQRGAAANPDMPLVTIIGVVSAPADRSDATYLPAARSREFHCGQLPMML